MNRKALKIIRQLSVPVIVIGLTAAVMFSLGIFSPRVDLMATNHEPAISELYSMEDFTIEPEDALVKYAENGRFVLYINTASGSIAVEDKQNGSTWYSSPFDDPSQETLLANIDTADKNFMNSIVTLGYYHPSGTRQYLYSTKDCVDKKQFLITKNADGVAMTFVFGNLEAELLLVPSTIAGPDFEAKVLQNSAISDEDLFNIKRYYIKNASGDYDFGSNFGKVAQQNALDIFGRLGLDPQKDFQSSGTGEGEISKTPLFSVTVYISLDSTGMKIRVPVSEIKFSKTFPIADIGILEYFGAGSRKNDGYILVPDGSGSLIRFGSGKAIDGRFSFPVYGEDATKGIRYEQDRSQTATLPVFGISRDGEGFLAVIESGDSLASIEGARSGSVKRPYSNVHAVFNLIGQDSVVLGEGEYDAKTYAYQKSIFEGDLALSYRFCENGESDYTAMANLYRDYLLGTYGNVLADKNTSANADVLPFYAEFIGAVTGPRSFLGFSYEGLDTLTTFRQAGEVAGDLQKDGVGNVNIRLTGFFNNGYDQSLPVRFKPLRILGGASGYKDLLSDAKTASYTVFTNVLFQTSYVGDGFNINRKSAKTMDERNARIYTFYNPIDKKGYDPRYILSPRYLPDVVGSWLARAVIPDAGAFSLQDLGSRLYQDYNGKAPVTREESRTVVTSMLEQISGKVPRIMMDSANAYALPYAGEVLNAAMSDSGYMVEDQSVPFYQIAARGIASCAGQPLNTAADPDQAFLKSIEYGCGIYYRWIFAPSQATKETDQPELYSLNYQLSYDDAVRYYKLANEALASVQGAAILRHTADTGVKDVTMTEYGNGIRIYVNYGNEAAQIDGLTVEARNFAKKEG